MVLNPRRLSLVASKDEICANGNSENPIVGLYNEELRHEAVVATEGGILGCTDKSTGYIHRSGAEEVDGHDEVAHGEAKNKTVAE